MKPGLQRITYIIGLLSWFILLASCDTCNPSFIAPDHFEINLDLKGNFEIKEEQNSEKKQRVVWNDGENVLAISKIKLDSTGHAENILKGKRFLIENLFKDQPHPYPDVVSNRKACPEEFQPKVLEKKHEDGWMFSYRIFANQRFVYGGCSEAVNHYASIYVFLFCTSKNVLYEIKYFTPMDKPSTDLLKLIESVKCN